MRLFALFLKATRANFLPASIIPFLVGTALAYQQGYLIHWLKFTVVICGIVSAHLAGNLFNDYFDDKSGADQMNPARTPFFGGSGVIQLHILSPKTILKMAVVFLVLSLVSGGIMLYLMKSWAILWLMLIAGVLTVQYTAPPLRLCYRKLGELDIFILFGVMLTMGSFYIYAREFTFRSFMVSLPIAFLIAMVIVCNEVPDVPSDCKVRKNNLVVALGQDKGFILYSILTFLSILALILCVIRGFLPLLTLIVLPVYFLAVKAVRILKNNSFKLSQMVRASQMTIILHTLAGIFTTLTLLL